MTPPTIIRLRGRMSVAILFCDPKGIYSTIPGCELWDEKRDARKYGGPHPVVAHPPCQLWGNFAAVNFKRWGGEHNRPGNDGGRFASALASVRQWGGVLEHPAHSRAWAAHGLPDPEDRPAWTAADWTNGPGRATEWVCEVWQSAYGHKARKRTWLYYCGNHPPADMNWSRPVGTHQIGFHDQRGRAANKTTISGRAASATPPAFAEALIALARGSKP